MCTRFYIEPQEVALQKLGEAALRAPLAKRFEKEGKTIVTSGEIFPSYVVPVIASNPSLEKTVYPMEWGFTLYKSHGVLNARSETAREKSSFRESWARRRCMIPASLYYEWEHFREPSGKIRTGTKYAIRPLQKSADGLPALSPSSGTQTLAASVSGSLVPPGPACNITWLCGLYRIEPARRIPQFVVLTRDAGPGLSLIHNRMPLILPGDLVDAWISPAADPDELARQALTEMEYAPVPKPSAEPVP